MAERDFDAVFYVRKAPTIRIEEGMFFICYSVGRAQFEFVLRPSIWQQTRRQADLATEEFQAAKGSVTQMRRRKPPVAH